MIVVNSRDRIVVSTLRCGRNNPGSNPGHGTFSTITEFEDGNVIAQYSPYLRWDSNPQSPA